jgi:hypothetical protein
MFEALAGWGVFLAEIAKYVGLKKLREHSDRYAQLEKELLEESQKDYTQRDDLRFVALSKEMAITRDAFLRDMQLKDK